MDSKEAKGIKSVIAASSVGTMIEWYDFYIFGSLAPIIATKFFPRIILQRHCCPPWLHLLRDLL